MKNNAIIKSILGLALIWKCAVIGLSQQLPQRPYESIDLQGMTYKWYETAFDTSKLFYSDGYNVFKEFKLSAVSGEYFYTAVMQQELLGLTGFYLDKRAIHDGSLVWRTLHGYPTQDYASVPLHLYINEDGDIELFCQRYPDIVSESEAIGSKEMVFEWAMFHQNDGTLMAYNVGDPDDVLSFRSDYTALYKLTLNSTKRLDRDLYEFWEFNQNTTEPRRSWVRSIVSSDSKLPTVQSDTSVMTDYPILISPLSLESGHYIIFELILPDKLSMRHLDHDMHVIRIDTTDIIVKNAFNLDILGINETTEQILFINGLSAQPDDEGYIQHELIWMSFDGDILSSLTLNKKYFDNIYPTLWYEDGLKGIAVYINPEESTSYGALDFIEVSGGDVKVYERYYPADDLRSIADINIIDYDQAHNDIIVAWHEVSLHKTEDGYTTRDFNSSALSYSRISLDGRFVSTDDPQDTEHNDLMVYPNPCADILHLINTNSRYTKAILLDAMGQMVKSYDIKDIPKTTMDISFIPRGTYIMQIMSDDHNVSENITFVKM